MIEFEDFDGEVKDIPPVYQKAICHLISDIKMGQNFWSVFTCPNWFLDINKSSRYLIFDIFMVENSNSKARMVTRWHMTEIPEVLTYAPIVSKDGTRICLTIAALTDLKVLPYDI